jgi:hypothetical protein
MKKDVYNMSNINKCFLSVDMKSGNFTALRDTCPSIFIDPLEDGRILNWYEFVKQFTKSEFLAKSKYFRELIFGMTGFIGKANILQEIYMDKIHNIIDEWSKSNLDIELKMKAGDELVYEIKDTELFLSKLDSLKERIGKDDLNKLHFRLFKVNSVDEKPYFVKTFIYNTDWFDELGILKESSKLTLKDKIEFKKVPKYFMPQVIKWYNKEQIQDEDLIFMHEGIMAKYLSTIFE